MRHLPRLSHQAVGAFGERAVEAELLRHGWIPANVNATVKNAADFDIYAVKDGHTLHLRVRACGPDSRAFQFGAFDPGEQVKVGKFSDTDRGNCAEAAALSGLEEKWKQYLEAWNRLER